MQQIYESAKSQRFISLAASFSVLVSDTLRFSSYKIKTEKINDHRRNGKLQIIRIKKKIHVSNLREIWKLLTA